jgi:hypothetical protein|tara:strand:+ start:2109 stop:2798 length:690 start_codon:yes stop_codon:yes gene_type:complete
MAIYLNGTDVLLVGSSIATSADCCCCCLDANDDFGGTGDNSGSVGDANYDCRWSNTTPGSSSIAIVSNALDLVGVSANTGRVVIAANQFAQPVSGDFAVSVAISNVGTPGASQESAAYLTLIVGGTQYEAGIQNSNITSNNGGYISYPFPTVQTEGSVSASTTATISRTGSTITVASTSGTLSTTVTNSGTLTSISLVNAFYTTGAAYSDTVTFDTFTATDGTNPLPLC